MSPDSPPFEAGVIVFSFYVVPVYCHLKQKIRFYAKKSNNIEYNQILAYKIILIQDITVWKNDVKAITLTVCVNFVTCTWSCMLVFLFLDLLFYFTSIHKPLFNPISRSALNYLCFKCLWKPLSTQSYSNVTNSHLPFPREDCN